MVYYRKYRPQLISELDLDAVRDRLTKILSSDSIPHAFLFTGSRGLGKTSSARILAKAINCTSSKTFEPCNECAICESITSGSHIDVIEIDGASNRGVDEIRELRSKVKFAPSELKKKVYIIDEVHMLTTEAFNALLKTLEEPPEHVVFILATTEAHKIPQTILSRAFSVKFEHPTRDEIAVSLKRIAEGEKITIDDEVISQIASLAEGSFRDAAKILEELSLSAASKKITKNVLDDVYKLSSLGGFTEKLLVSFGARNADEGLKIIQEASSSGVDFKRLIEELVRETRLDLLSNKRRFQLDESKRLLTLLNEAYANMKFSVVPQLPLELAVIEYSMGQKKTESSDKNTAQTVHSEKKEASRSQVVDQAPQRVERSNDFLKDLITAIHTDDKRIAAFLRSCKDAVITGNTLLLTTPYSLHAEKLNKPEFSSVILKHAKNLNPTISEVSASTV